MKPLDSFTAWFKAHGGYLHPSVEFASTSDQGYILRVKRDAEGGHNLDGEISAQTNPSRRLPPNTTVISAPHVNSLSALDASSSLSLSRSRSVFHNRGPPLTSIPDELRSHARPQCIAAIWLCAQYLLGDRSSWYEYMTILPLPPSTSLLSHKEQVVADNRLDLERGDAYDANSEEEKQKEKERVRAAQQRDSDTPEPMDTAMWWTDDERDWVRGTNLWRGIEDLEGIWASEWRKCGDIARRWAEENGLVGMEWHLFKWAISIYGSRAFSSALLSFVEAPSLPEVPILERFDPHALLYPGMDMLNHYPATRNRWFCDAERFGLICEDEPVPGEQIWNSYGKKGNAELLLSFGFAQPRNHFDAFALKLPPTQPSLLLSLLSPPKPDSDAGQIGADAFVRAANSARRRLPSTTRFPSDVNESSEGPRKSLSLDETDTLESHDPDVNVYFVRPPSFFISPPSTSENPSNRDILSSNTANNVAKQGYGALPATGTAESRTSRSQAYKHLDAFPTALIAQLATQLANQREANIVTAAAGARKSTPTFSNPTSNEATARDSTSHSESGLSVLWQTSPRAELAVSALLLSRLDMEYKRLTVLLDGPLSDVPAHSNVKRNEGSPTSSVAVKRKQNARTYVNGQVKLLQEVVEGLKSRIWAAFVPGGVNVTIKGDVDTVSDSSTVETTAEEADAHLGSLRDLEDLSPTRRPKLTPAASQSPFQTITSALKLLRRVAPSFADEFVAGMFPSSCSSSSSSTATGRRSKRLKGDANVNPNGNADSTSGLEKRQKQDRAILDELDSIRAAKDPQGRDEEDIFVLLVAALFVVLFSTEAEASVHNEHVDGMRRWKIWSYRGLGGLNSFAASLKDPNSREATGHKEGQQIQEQGRGDIEKAAHTGTEQEEDDQGVLETALSARDQVQRMLRRTSSAPRLWSHPLFANLSFLKACVKVVMDESVAVNLSLSDVEYNILRRTEEKFLGPGDTEGDISSEAGSGVEQEEQKGGETQMELRLVALFIGN